MGDAMQPVMLAIGFALTVVHFYAEPLRWRQAYVRDSSWQSTRDIFLSTSLASYLLPFKLGMPLRILLCSRILAIGAPRLAAIIAVDSVVILGAWGAIALLVGADEAIELVRATKVPWAGWLAVGAVLALALAALYSQRLRVAAMALLDTARSMPRRLATAIGVAGMDVLTYGPRHAAIAIAVGLPSSRWEEWASFGIVATFAGIISGMPMGLVGYDATLMLLLGSAGVDPGQGLLIIAINRAMSIAAAFLLGVPAARRIGMGEGVAAVYRKVREMARGR
jgi:hypothetical protein